MLIIVLTKFKKNIDIIMSVCEFLATRKFYNYPFLVSSMKVDTTEG